MPESFLEHYGKKGMKWGVRKDRPSSKKGKSARQIAKTLTDAELKKRVNRLNMEKQYVDLVKGPSSSVSKGRGLVTQMLKTAGKQKAQSLVTEGVSKYTDLAIKKAKTRG